MTVRRRRRWLIGAAVALSVLSERSWSDAPSASFTPSYIPGTQDASGQPMGGTEIRALVAHGGRLFAGDGDWKETGSPPGAQILVLDRPDGAWRVDHTFGDWLRGGRRRHLAISVLDDVTFRTDTRGVALPAPVAMLIASTWDLTGTRTIFTRDDATGAWSGTVIAIDKPSPGFLPQIRSFGFQRDRQTGIDLAFAGDTRGIFAGAYDPAVTGRIRWTGSPELAIGSIDTAGFPGLSGRLRISSFAEASGRLCAAIGQQVWVREDGPTPQWRPLYTNPNPHYSQTGLRGLTTLRTPGRDDVLLAAIEGNHSRIVRIDPVTGAESTDLDLAGFLDTAWGTGVSYVIGAYNDMARVGADLVIGLEAFIPPAAPRPPGHTVLPVINGLEGGAWFLVRHPNGRYDLHQVLVRLPGIGQNLVAARSIVASPFPNDAGAIYLGGYDANDTPAHNTGWIVRGAINPSK